ncbi:glycosyltransferase family 2 protein, partial [Planktothrix sp. FACHB-1355]|nr:glycosyltransferase family 2 protein [Planktothrix sp. FACHB-1355]
FAWCTLQAFYEYLILLKVWEMKHMPAVYADPVGTLSSDREENVDSAKISPSI